MNNRIGITFLDELDEVCRDEILVDDAPEGPGREALTNIWAFSVTQQQAEQMAVAQVTDFIQAIVEARREQLLGRYGTSHQMYFYLWCDEQASQLCFSLVSARHGQIPFGLPPHIVPAPSPIIERFLNLPYHDGIPLDEMEEITVDEYVEIAEHSLVQIEVWTQLLP